jgi:uroporphyrin-III C-methyltransferase/precorrin-2 dehydrogenase/sirohydrochlorin ferrochelatase
MRYLPLHFDLTDRPVLVVGGGEIARRKVEILMEAGAAVTLVAPEVASTLTELLKPGQILRNRYEASLLDGVVLVVAATNDGEVNAAVSEDAQALNIPVNVVDTPELCTVTFPAIINRDPLVISVGTAGGSPVLTRFVRTLIEQLIPERFSVLAQYLRDRRDHLKMMYSDVESRRRKTEAFLDSPGAELAMGGAPGRQMNTCWKKMMRL